MPRRPGGQLLVQYDANRICDAQNIFGLVPWNLLDTRETKKEEDLVLKKILYFPNFEN